MDNISETLSFIGQGAFVVAMLRKVLQRVDSEKKDGSYSTGSSTREYTFRTRRCGTFEVIVPRSRDHAKNCTFHRFKFTSIECRRLPKFARVMQRQQDESYKVRC